jgi:hypothetical protein
VHTNNGVEAQNRVFKHDYLAAYKSRSLSFVIKCLITEFFEDAYRKYASFFRKQVYAVFVSCFTFISSYLNSFIHILLSEVRQGFNSMLSLLLHRRSCKTERDRKLICHAVLMPPQHATSILTADDM